jgi:hypothetical protein
MPPPPTPHFPSVFEVCCNENYDCATVILHMVSNIDSSQPLGFAALSLLLYTVGWFAEQPYCCCRSGGPASTPSITRNCAGSQNNSGPFFQFLQFITGSKSLNIHKFHTATVLLMFNNLRHLRKGWPVPNYRNTTPFHSVIFFLKRAPNAHCVLRI